MKWDSLNDNWVVWFIVIAVVFWVLFGSQNPAEWLLDDASR